MCAATRATPRSTGTKRPPGSPPSSSSSSRRVSRLTAATLIEVRGDEGLAVFTSARQAIRAAVDLQARFAEETDADSDLPLKVGIGIDSGEAVQLEDGSYRGAALNVAARLCGRAHGGEVIVSEATSRLAGRLAGMQYSDRGRVHLKNIPEPIHILQVYSELDAPPHESLGADVLRQARPDARLEARARRRRRSPPSRPRALSTSRPATPTASAAAPTTTGTNGVLPDATPRRSRWPRTPGSTRSCPRRSGRTASCRRCPSRTRSRPLSASRRRDCRTAGRSPRTGAAPTSCRRTGPEFRATRASQSEQRQLQRLHLGRRAPVAPRPGQARRAGVLLLRRQRRGHRLDATSGSVS